MSVANLLKGHYMDGGPFFMTLHFITWILVILYVVKFIQNFKSNNKDLKKLEKFNSTILFVGAFGLLFSWFYRMIGMYSAFTIAENAQDISPALLAGGLRVSLIAPLYAFFLFLVTSIIWFSFRNKIKALS